MCAWASAAVLAGEAPWISEIEMETYGIEEELVPKWLRTSNTHTNTHTHTHTHTHFFGVRRLYLMQTSQTSQPTQTRRKKQNLVGYKGKLQWGGDGERFGIGLGVSQISLKAGKFH